MRDSYVPGMEKQSVKGRRGIEQIHLFASYQTQEFSNHPRHHFKKKKILRIITDNEPLEASSIPIHRHTNRQVVIEVLRRIIQRLLINRIEKFFLLYPLICNRHFEPFSPI